VTRAVYICKFSGDAFDSLSARDRRDYQAVKAAVLADGRFSAFDATSTDALARIFDRLEKDPEVEMGRGEGYPWITIRLKSAPEVPQQKDGDA
jgi:hypothetical protein